MGVAGRPWASGILAIFAGPLLIMYPTTDNFAVFGATGAASLYCSMAPSAPDARGPGWWRPARSRGWRRLRESMVSS